MSAPPTIFDLLPAGEWLMTPGERAALEGVLAIVRPSLSIEIGTWTGGSLERISAHSQTVHAFDLRRHPDVTPERFPNVTFHIGSSHEILPEALERLAAAGENVDFALVDGDHSAQGVRKDLEDLLSSSSVGRTVILLHDTLNERVRAGLEQVDFNSFESVRFVDLDFVQGCVVSEGPQKDELWYGLGLVVVGWELGEGAAWPRAYAAPNVYDAFSKALVASGAPEPLGYTKILDLERELAGQRELLRLMERSWSWRLTAPLRAARGLARRDAPRVG